MFYWTFLFWNHMISFHFKNKHNNRSATCYKAFKQDKLIILRLSSHIHCYGQVSVSHGNLCISQIIVMGTQITGRVIVGPTVNETHGKLYLMLMWNLFFFTQKIRRPCKEYQKDTINSQFNTASVRHD